MTQYADLIARLEGALWPQRGLDAWMHEASGWTREASKGHFCWISPDGKTRVSDDGVPRYTENINHALMALDPGWEYEISTLYGVARVEVALNEDACTSRAERKDGHVPLALCTAAIRAREQLETKG